jgi:hypothetical protein
MLWWSTKQKKWTRIQQKQHHSMVDLVREVLACAFPPSRKACLARRSFSSEFLLSWKPALSLSARKHPCAVAAEGVQMSQSVRGILAAATDQIGNARPFKMVHNKRS